MKEFKSWERVLIYAVIALSGWAWSHAIASISENAIRLERVQVEINQFEIQYYKDVNKMTELLTAIKTRQDGVLITLDKIGTDMKELQIKTGRRP